MKKVVVSLFLPLLLLLGTGYSEQAAAQGVSAKRTVDGVIRCQSPGGRYSTCAADTARGVRIGRDFSNRCRLGQNWGYTRSEIWVNDGCDAEFEIGRAGDTSGYGWGHSDSRIVVCASEDYRREFCPARTGMGVRLVNQISRSECVRGRTWWRDESGIVVTSGCAGEFEINYREDAYQWPPSTGSGGMVRPNEIRCESIDDRKRYCPADIGRGRAALAEQHSRSSCVFGRTWGFDSRGVWVDRGCRATFRFDYVGANSSWYPQSGQNYTRCESRDYSLSECRVGREVRSVRLVRRISDSACVEGRSWGFRRGSIWVDDGCAADFELN